MLPGYKTLLYCTRLGPQSPHVLEHALALARALGARVIALHVVENASGKWHEPLVEPYEPGRVRGEIPSREDQMAADRLQRRIAAVCERSEDPSTHRLVERIVVARGHVAEQVLKFAREYGADLIVMGARAEGEDPEAPIGRTASKIVGHGNVPVLSVRTPEGYVLQGVSDI